MMTEAGISIQFLSDLMQDRLLEEDVEQIDKGVTRKGAGADKKKGIDHIADAINHAYVNDKGELYIPRTWVHNCINEAARFQLIGKSSMTRFMGLVSVIGDNFLIMRNGKPVLIGECEVDKRHHNVHMNGQILKRIKYRTILHVDDLNPVTATFVLRWDDDTLSVVHIRQLLKDAGMMLGFGSYRPQHKGEFGKFMPIKIELLRQWDLSDKCEVVGFPKIVAKATGNAKPATKRGNKAVA